MHFCACAQLAAAQQMGERPDKPLLPYLHLRVVGAQWLGTDWAQRNGHYLVLCSVAGLHPSFSDKNLFFCCGVVLVCFVGDFWGGRLCLGFFGVGQSAWNVFRYRNTSPKSLRSDASENAEAEMLGELPAPNDRKPNYKPRPRQPQEKQRPSLNATDCPLLWGSKRQTRQLECRNTKIILITQQDWLLQSSSLCIFFYLPLDVHYYHDLFWFY